MRRQWLPQILLVASSALVAAGELDEREFAKLHAEVRPADGEAWRTVPWRISLLDAQRDAASEKKPLFIWAMDGHPLGCT